MNVDFIDCLGAIASFTSIIGFLPQIYKNYKTRSVQDLSFLMLLNFFVCSLAWTLYGSLTHSPYVFITNVMCLAASAVLVSQKLSLHR